MLSPGWLLTLSEPSYSTVLRQLHWLTVRQRVVFKTATVVHRSLSGNAPGYLADDCELVADARVRQLRWRHSNTRCQLDAQQFKRRDLCRCRTTNLERSAAQTQTIIYAQFTRLLKTFLFGQ